MDKPCCVRWVSYDESDTRKFPWGLFYVMTFMIYSFPGLKKNVICWTDKQVSWLRWDWRGNCLCFFFSYSINLHDWNCSKNTKHKWQPRLPYTCPDKIALKLINCLEPVVNFQSLQVKENPEKKQIYLIKCKNFIWTIFIIN